MNPTYMTTISQTILMLDDDAELPLSDVKLTLVTLQSLKALPSPPNAGYFYLFKAKTIKTGFGINDNSDGFPERNLIKSNGDAWFRSSISWNEATNRWYWNTFHRESPLNYNYTIKRLIAHDWKATRCRINGNKVDIDEFLQYAENQSKADHTQPSS